MKNFTLLFCTLSLVLICDLQLSFAQTSVPGGNISGHWTLDGSPYNITGTVTIPTLSTLTIDPGVTVSFQPYSSLSDSGFTMFVQGQLLAVGTPDDTIIFTASNTTIGFRGIRFVDGYNYPGNDSSRLMYCKIQYGIASGSSYLFSNGNALLFDNWSNAVVSHCLLSQCGNNNENLTTYGGAIFCDSASSPIISYNTISSNTAMNGYGGGIYCSYASNPTISYNTISNNSCDGTGGGIACFYASPTISNNIISYNSCPSGGGGIYCFTVFGYACNPIISYNAISYNSVSYPNTYGGGIYSVGASPIISYNDISYNYIYAPGGGAYGAHGGGIYIGSYYGDVNDTIASINNNNISYNFVGGELSYGGGIACEAGIIVSSINNNIISYNYSDGVDAQPDGVGGGVYCSASTVSSMSYNTISNNFANAAGGGIYCANNINAVGGGSGIDSISNTTITNNIAGTGGGIYCSGSSPNMLNLTIANNYANPGAGGALYCDASAQPNLYNCILWGDSSSQSGGGNELFQNDGLSVPSFYYCDVQGGEASLGLAGNTYTGTYSNNINADPKFVSPSSGIGNGFDGVGANWSVQAGSLCIDAGNPNGIYPATDLTGNPRISGCIIDIGAYEFQKAGASSLPAPTVTASGSTTFCQGGSVILLTSAASNYAWSNGATTQSITVTTSGNYFVTVTSNGCSGVSSSTVVTVNPTPTVNAVGNQTICSGSSTIAVNFSGTASSYSWTNNDPSIGLATSDTGNIVSFTAINNGTIPETATITVTPVSSGFAYIANWASNTVSVINTTSNTVTTTIPVGSGPQGVCVSPDGSRVYVANSNSNTVSVINTVSNTVSDTIIVGDTPFGVSESPDGSKVYVANATSGIVSVINTSTNLVTASITVGNEASSIIVNSDGSLVYTSCGNDSIYVINATTNTVTATIGINARGILALSPNGKNLYVSTGTRGTILVINTSDNTIITTIAVGGDVEGLSISADGSNMYISNYGSDSVSIMNITTNTVTSTISDLGHGPFGISISPDGKEVYVANASTANVSVINTATYTVTNIIAVGNIPYSFGNFVTSNGCNGIPATFNITVNSVLTSNTTVTACNSYIWNGTTFTSSAIVTDHFTNAAGCDSAATLNLTINTSSTPAVAVVNSCNKTSKLTASGYTGSLLWSTGATTSSITVTTANNYSVTQTINGCKSTAGIGTAIPGATPSTPVVTVANNCGSSTLSTTATGSLLWNVGAATTSAITVTTAETITLKQTVNGCTSAAGSSKSAPHAVPAKPVVKVVNDCGHSILSTTAKGTLLWNTGAVKSSITITAPGTYSVTLTVNGCVSSEGIGVASPKSAPAIPGAIAGNASACKKTGPITYSVGAVASATSYTWTIPSGCTAPSLTTTVPDIAVKFGAKAVTGNITVKASNSCGTSAATSKTITVNCRMEDTIPDASATTNMIAYPNPAHNTLNVDFRSVNKGEYMIKMFDMTGRILLNKIADANQGDNHLEFDISNFASGLYILSFTSEEESKQLRIVVE